MWHYSSLVCTLFFVFIIILRFCLFLILSRIVFRIFPSLRIYIILIALFSFFHSCFTLFKFTVIDCIVDFSFFPTSVLLSLEHDNIILFLIIILLHKLFIIKKNHEKTHWFPTNSTITVTIFIFQNFPPFHGSITSFSHILKSFMIILNISFQTFSFPQKHLNSSLSISNPSKHRISSSTLFKPKGFIFSNK